MKIKWSLDINTGAVERSEAARARRLAGAKRRGKPRVRNQFFRGGAFLPLNKLRLELILGGSKFNVTGHVVFGLS